MEARLFVGAGAAGTVVCFLLPVSLKDYDFELLHTVIIHSQDRIVA